MAIDGETIQSLLAEESKVAWELICAEAKDCFLTPFSSNPTKEIVKREKEFSGLELALAGSAWSLWQEFESAVPKASEKLVDWWASGFGGKAALLLDGLSLREVPLLAEEAKKRGYVVTAADIVGSELPGETDAFAKALGFSHRGSLDNNGAGGAHRMKDAFTLSNDLPWLDVAALVPAESRLFVWHHWPDHRIHEYSDQGEGLRRLFPEIVKQLQSDEFWALADKLATGRELVISSDHGYADSGSFRDADAEEKAFFKENFGGQRYKPGELTTQEWLPPLALTLNCPTGRKSMAVGRTKWAVQGGNRTLSHGGLTLLETLVPFIQLSKT